MRMLKKTITLILIFSIIYTIAPSLLKDAFAAPKKVAIKVVSYKDNGDGKDFTKYLTIGWDLNGTPSAKSIDISYHTPDDPAPKSETYTINPIDPKNPKVLSAKLTQLSNVLENDYIYDIDLDIYDKLGGAAGGGNIIGEGFLYFLPQITFFSERLEQEPTGITGGGQAIGLIPKLNLRWMIPMVYSEDDGNYVPANMPNGLSSIENSCGKKIDSLNFRINISTDQGKLNDSPTQSSLIINDTNGTLKANVSNRNDFCTIKEEDDTGFVNFNLQGRSDLSSTKPDPSEIEANTLYDEEILPGTVYYLNISPEFRDIVDPDNPADDKNVTVLTVGVFGSPLMGMPYNYTPIRFQLTKDGIDNVYVKIFKVNKGSLSLPRLYYEIQASADPSIPGDWPLKKTIDDTFFAPGSESALTVITGTNPNNKIYYRIVVKSDSAPDRIDSWSLPYMLADDTSRPPLPKNVTIVPNSTKPITKPATEGDPESSELLKSTEFTISWEKPANWDDIQKNLTPDDDIVYHFMFNTFQTDLSSTPQLVAEGKDYGHFPIIYRMQKYVSARSKNIKDLGKCLEYTINGFDLYKGEYLTGFDPDGNPQMGIDDFFKEGDGEVVKPLEPEKEVGGDPNNPKVYPTYLLPNKAYYVQVYTTAGKNRGSTEPANTSDKSIIVSLTTVVDNEREVPLPANFKLGNNIYDKKSTPTNQIELLFDQVTVNPNNYITDPDPDAEKPSIFYDLYMRTRTESDSLFTFIGSSDPSVGVSDAEIIIEPNKPGRALIRKIFDKDADPSNNPKPPTVFYNGEIPSDIFGDNIKSNTTYYFVLQTRLVIPKDGELVSKFSRHTAVLPVTTRVEIEKPSDENRNPLAPIDFAIAKDSKGNLILTGNSVTFKWKTLENNVSYEIVRTSERLAPESSIDSYLADPLYEHYEIDPSDPNYRYTAPMNEYTIKKLFPNSLYYFSIRAISKNTEKKNTSPWVSIPVTTLLVAPPTALEPVNDAELGFSWSDPTPFVKAEDYKVYLKGPKDNDFKLMTTSQVTVTKSKDGSTYFGRIRNLLTNTTYDVRVNRSGYEEVLPALSTRDKYHEVEVRWKGTQDYDYELAIKSAQSSEYTTLLDEDMEEYINLNSNAPANYYIEESTQTGPNECYFYARIKTMQVKLPDDSTEHQPLKSNIRYYIKVRTVQVDPLGITPDAYSKYIGPATTRTEFSQIDYDNDDNDKKDNAKFLDRISKLEEDIFWRLSIGDKAKNSILLKGDRVINSMQNNGRLPFTLDISTLAATYSVDVIYMPINVVQQVNSQNSSLIIKTVGAEFTLRPYTINLEKDEKIATVNNSTDVKDMLVKLTIARKKTAQGLTSDIKPISDFHTLAVQAIGTSTTYATLKEQVHDKLYNVDTGLVIEKSNKLMSELGKNNSEDLQDNEKYINDLIEEVKDELSDYISDTINSSFVPSKSVNVVSFDAPLLSKIFYTDKSGSKLPYVKYDGETRKKISTNLAPSPNAITFNAAKTGEYAIMLTQGSIENDIQPGFDAKDDINGFMLKYNLKDILGSYDSIYPDSSVSVKDIVSLYEKIVGNPGRSIGLDTKQTAKKLGLDTLINATNPSKNVLRQETAGVLIKLYSLKIGVSSDTLKPKKNIFINDDKDVGNRYYKAVILCIDAGIMPPRSDESFAPNEPVTKSEMLSGFVRVLKMTGDM